MKRLLMLTVPVWMLAGSALAQSHDHSHHAVPTKKPVEVIKPEPHAGHDMSSHAGHGAAASAQADPHAGHDMSGHASHGATAPTQADPHAGHDMSGHAGHGAAAPVQADPHAGHDMGGHAGHGAAAPVQADPHAGHDMSGHAGHGNAAPVQADPHSGHNMSGHEGHGATAPTQADPHAGHDMSSHAGHDMSNAIPEVKTSVDSHNGRLVEPRPPAGAYSGPAHAADTIYDPVIMGKARQQLLAENGDVRTTAVLIDHLEARFGDEANTYVWAVQGFTGGDINRFWWKTEGEGEFDGRLHEVEVQALYSRAIAPFWDVQAGVRHDYQPDGPDRSHLVLGIQGAAPYWFEVSGAGFVSTKGDLTASFEAEYDLRLTQKWILQPMVEVAASAQDIPELEMGSGLTSVTAGLRLRYEIKREFAPYVGIETERLLGQTADMARAHGEAVDDLRFVVGLKAWF